MSVIKNMRNLSSMEFYKKAIDLRKEITIWLLKDFGYKRNARSVKRVIKDISEEDKKTIDDIFIKYGKNANKEYESVYPEWFVEDERKIIMEILQSMMINITKANSIYVTNTLEYETRRMYQDKAIGDCYCLYHEIQYITTIFPTNLNNLVFLLDDIEREIDLLRGWRASDKSRFNKGKA